MPRSVLPVHPSTGLTAIGWRAGGHPIWPVMGGAEDGEGDAGPKGADDGAEGNDGADLAAEVEKWKTLARKHEDRAKSNASAAADLDKLRKAQMSEQEKAVQAARDTAKAEARGEVLRELGGQLVEAQVRVAAAGRLATEKVTALVEGLDPTRFLTVDGKVDADKVTAWVDRIADKPGTGAQNGKTPDMGQGRRQPAAGKPSLSSGAERWRSTHPVKTSA